MSLCWCEVFHLEKYLGEAEEGLVVSRIMPQTLLVAFKGSCVVLLYMLNFAEREVEYRA